MRLYTAVHKSGYCSIPISAPIIADTLNIPRKIGGPLGLSVDKLVLIVSHLVQNTLQAITP